MSVSHIASFSARIGSIAVTPQGFGTPLLVGYHTNFPQDVKTYSGDSASILQSLVDDGFTAGVPIHEMARVLLSQETVPREIKVGRLDTAYAQTLDYFPLNGDEGTEYELTFELNGLTEVATYTVAGGGETPTAVSTGIRNAITAFTSVAITAVSNTTGLTITADNAGDVFRLTSRVNGVIGNPAHADIEDMTAAPAGLATRLAELSAADDDWYFLLADLNSDAIANIYGDYVASLTKLYVGSISDAGATETGTTTDFMSDMIADLNDRAGCFWDGKYNGYAQCALVGKLAPRTPGSVSWVNQTLRQVTTPGLSSTLFNNLTGKRYTVFRPASSTLSATRGGNVGGTFTHFDVTRGLDWLKVRSQESIANLLLSNDKIPFTISGLAAIRAALQDVVDRAVANGLLSAGDPDDPDNPPPRVIVPELSDVTAADKAARVLRNVKITGVLAGSIDTVVNGEIVVEF